MVAARRGCAACPERPRGKILKILNFTRSLPPPCDGGMLYGYNIISRFPAGSVVTHTALSDPVVELAHDRQFPHRVLRSRGLNPPQRAARAGTVSRVWPWIWWPAGALRLILRERPDVVYLAQFNGAAMGVMAAKRMLGTPYLLIAYAHEAAIRIRWRTAYFLAAARSADAILTVCEFTRRLLVAKGVAPERIHKVLPPVGEEKRTAVEIQDLEPTRRQYGLEGRKLLFTAGRLGPGKGHDRLLAVLPQIARAVPSVTYVIAGSGREEPRLRETAARLGLDSRVRFAGQVSDRELSALYELCDVFVLPNYTVPETGYVEGCPTVLLEAAAHGKPSIAGNSGGTEDAVLDGQTGFIVDTSDAGALAGAVVRLLADPERARRMGEAGRKYVGDMTPGRAAAAVWEITEKITANHP